MKVHNIYGCNLRSASHLLIDAEYSSLNCSSSLVYFFVEKRYKKLLQSKNTTQHIQNPVLCDKTRTGMIDDRKQLTVFRGCCKTSASPWSGWAINEVTFIHFYIGRLNAQSWPRFRFESTVKMWKNQRKSSTVPDSNHWKRMTQMTRPLFEVCIIEFVNLCMKDLVSKIAN